MAATSTIVLVFIAAAAANAQCDFSGWPTGMSGCHFSDNACGTPYPAGAAVVVAGDSAKNVNPTRPNCWDYDMKMVLELLDAQYYSCNDAVNSLAFDANVESVIRSCGFPGECYDKRTTDCAFTNTNTNTTTTTTTTTNTNTNTGDAHRDQPSTLLAMLYILIPMGLIPAAVAACGRR
jgi:hypothetical protein